MNHTGEEFLLATQLPLFCEDLEGGAHQADATRRCSVQILPQRLTPNDIGDAVPGKREVGRAEKKRPCGALQEDLSRGRRQGPICSIGDAL